MRLVKTDHNVTKVYNFTTHDWDLYCEVCKHFYHSSNAKEIDRMIENHPIAVDRMEKRAAKWRQ